MSGKSGMFDAVDWNVTFDQLESRYQDFCSHRDEIRFETFDFHKNLFAKRIFNGVTFEI